MNWLRVEELLLIHEAVIEETAGICGITNPGVVESTQVRPFTSFGKMDLFPGILDKVAASG